MRNGRTISKTALAAAISLLAVACGVSGSSDAGSSEAPQGWTTHREEGFSVNHPHDWQVRADKSSGRVELRGNRGEQAVVWPLFVARPLQASSALAALGQMAGRLWPNARWEQPEMFGEHAARVRGRLGAGFAACVMTWVSSPKGTATFLYAMAAPEAALRESEAAFSQIFESFHAAGAPTEGPARAAPRVNYVRWQDPRENAFSIEVPQGWTVNGGLFRLAPVDTRLAWKVVSPDGLIRLSGGDADIPPFSLPTSISQFQGFREGSWYSPGYGVRMMVMRYKPGRQFVKEYVASTAARDCTQLAFTDERDRPDAVEALNRLNAAYRLPTNLNAGEVTFTCRSNGQPMTGYYFAVTQLNQVRGMEVGTWHVTQLIGFLSREDKLEAAQEILTHIVKTGQPNPQWVAMQRGVTASTSTAIARTNEAVAEMLNESYRSRSRSMDEIARRRSNAMLSIEDVVDPQYGERFKVESGSNYYWIDQRGTIVGTDTQTRPDIDFREMVRLP